MTSTETTAVQAAVLVVDDNPLIVNVLKGLLSSQNYQVFACANGQEASTLLESKSVDVIICDVMMPTMDGYELHHHVRQNPNHAHIPFVFLTALGDQIDVSKAKEVGADDYLVKPFDPQNLLAVVRGKVLRSKSLRTLSEERYDSYRKRVVHTLSHEFRTPLVAINTGTELLLDQHGAMDPTKVRGLIEAIHRGGQRLERLVTDFMLLQQVEAGIAQKMFDQRGTVRNLAESIQQFFNSYVAQFEKDGIHYSLASQKGPTTVFVYEAQFHDILKRLVDNARKFTGVRKEVEVAVVPEDDFVRIEVRDRGLGMDIARINEAIDAFGQLDRERLEQQGGGLGLAIASRYAKINRGSLQFELRPEGGTIASLVLPVHKSA